MGFWALVANIFSLSCMAWTFIRAFALRLLVSRFFLMSMIGTLIFSFFAWLLGFLSSLLAKSLASFTEISTALDPDSPTAINSSSFVEMLNAGLWLMNADAFVTSWNLALAFYITVFSYKLIKSWIPSVAT